MSSDAQIQACAYEAWRPNIEKHVAASGGAVVPLGNDPDSYPEQHFDNYFVEGNPLSPDMIEAAAPLVEKNYLAANQWLLNDPESVTALDSIGQLLGDKKGVIFAPNHFMAMHPAFGLAMTKNYVQRQGHDFATGLIVSKMVSFMSPSGLRGEDGLPVSATGALKLLGNFVMTSYPRSNAVSQTLFMQEQPDLAKKNNRRVREMAKQLLDDGALLGIAPSGTTEKFDQRRGVYIIEPVQPGTAEMLTGDNVYMAPAAINFTDGNSFVKILEPRQLSSPNDVHGVMEEIAGTLCDNIPGTKVQYC